MRLNLYLIISPIWNGQIAKILLNDKLAPSSSEGSSSNMLHYVNVSVISKKGK